MSQSKGMNHKTAEVFDAIRNFDFLSEYMLIGGTALSMQLEHRLSEDLDFCKWQDNPSLKSPEVNWPLVEKALSEVGEVKTEILDLFQVNFLVNDVKLTFYSNAISNSREIKAANISDTIEIADVRSIGAMKLEVINRRNVFRDYYDIYAILKTGIPLREIVEKAGSYSKHRMRSKMILAMISDGKRFAYEKNFDLLEPKYKIDETGIEQFIRGQISGEYKKGK